MGLLFRRKNFYNNLCRRAEGFEVENQRDKRKIKEIGVILSIDLDWKCNLTS